MGPRRAPGGPNGHGTADQADAGKPKAKGRRASGRDNCFIGRDVKALVIESWALFGSGLDYRPAAAAALLHPEAELGRAQGVGATWAACASAGLGRDSSRAFLGRGAVLQQQHGPAAHCALLAATAGSGFGSPRNVMASQPSAAQRCRRLRHLLRPAPAGPSNDPAVPRQCPASAPPVAPQGEGRAMRRGHIPPDKIVTPKAAGVNPFCSVGVG